MKVTRLTANSVQIALLGFVNVYLVREPDGWTLIDTALLSAKAILAVAEAEGAAIRRIALTHAHGDHTGSLDQLASRLPHTEVLIGERESRLLRGDLSLDPGEPQTSVRGSFLQVKTTPTRLLHDGDQVGSLRVVGAPGHTPGQVGYMDERDGTLYVGDAWSTKGGLAVAGSVRVLFPLPALATWNKRVSLESGRRLHALAPKLLAVGHGDALRSPAPAMQRELDLAARRLG